MKSYWPITLTILFSAILFIEFNFLCDGIFDFRFTQKTVELKFIGEDDDWIFINPGEDEIFDTKDDIYVDSSTPLFLPEDAKITIELVSLDKLYCLEIMQLNIVEMVIPGMENYLHLNIEHPNKNVVIESAPMCGGHLDKLTKQIHFIKEKSYIKWLKKFS